MTEHFDWQTDEEDRPESQTGAVRATVRRRRWWVPALVALAGLLAVYWVVSTQVRKRVEEAEAARAADVLSSYLLIQQAAERQDSELFWTLLSGSDLEWAVAQQRQLTRGWLFNRQAFGLERQRGKSEILQVEMAPDLNSAVVTVEELYSIVSGTGLSQTVQLTRDEVYRRGERWLWASPKDDYWGGDIDATLSGQSLTMFYPKRDEGIVNRLWHDFGNLLDKYCAETAGVTCPADLRVHVRFSRQPEALIETADGFFRDGYSGGGLFYNGRSYEFTLPTPSLVGIPVDEPGYQTLKRGYGAYLFGALIEELIGDSCCEDEAQYQAAVRNQLVELGLMLWSRGRTLSVGAHSMSPPEASTILLCKPGLNRQHALLEYGWNSGAWEFATNNRYLTGIRGMPDGDGILALEEIPDGESVSIRIFLKRDGHEVPIFEGDLLVEDADRLSWEVREQEKRLLVRIQDLMSGGSKYFSYDLSQCDDAGCPVEVHNLLGTPTWSPNGSQLLVREYGLIWRRKGYANTPISDGIAPFWVDDTSYGFVSTVGDGQLILVRGPEGKEFKTVTGTEAMMAALPEEERPERLAIGHVQVNPGWRDHWLVLAFSLSDEGHAEEAFLFGLDRKTEAIELILRSEHVHSFNLSPESGWLAASYYDPEVPGWIIRNYNLVTQQGMDVKLPGANTAEYAPRFEWSDDGDWLSVIHQGVVTLVDPVQGLIQTVSPPEPGCFQLAWDRG